MRAPIDPAIGINPGDKLYYVREVDPYGEGPHTWEVESERVKQVRVDGFTFNRIVGFCKIHGYHQLGTAYHRTPGDALRAFIAARQRKIKSAQRTIVEAERAIAWAETESAAGDLRPPSESRGGIRLIPKNGVDE